MLRKESYNSSILYQNSVENSQTYIHILLWEQKKTISHLFTIIGDCYTPLVLPRLSAWILNHNKGTSIYAYLIIFEISDRCNDLAHVMVVMYLIMCTNKAAFSRPFVI